MSCVLYVALPNMSREVGLWSSLAQEQHLFIVFIPLDQKLLKLRHCLIYNVE